VEIKGKIVVTGWRGWGGTPGAEMAGESLDLSR